MFAACPLHCQACSQSGDEIKCNADRCDLGYGVSLEGKCEGNPELFSSLASAFYHSRNVLSIIMLRMLHVASLTVISRCMLH